MTEHLNIRIRAKAGQIRQGIIPSSSTGNTPQKNAVFGVSTSSLSHTHNKSAKGKQNTSISYGKPIKNIYFGGIINGVLLMGKKSFKYILQGVCSTSRSFSIRNIGSKIKGLFLRR